MGVAVFAPPVSKEEVMDTFKKPEISDKVWVDEILKSFYAPSLEYSFSTLFLWADIIDTKIAKHKSCLIARYGENHYLFPAGNNDEDKISAIEWILKHSDSAVSFGGVGEKEKEFLEKNFSKKFSYTENRNMGDYVYTTEQLSTLKGKKLSSKRNHINRFLENNPDWVYEKIDANNICEADQMHNEWEKMADAKSHKGLIDEGKVVKKALKYYDELGFFGGLLRVGGKVIAFSLGDELNQDTFLVHIEKAFYDIQGAYPMINKQFVLANCMDYKFINREEDTGDEGLRKAKLSYCPLEIIKKYTVKEIRK